MVTSIKRDVLTRPPPFDHAPAPHGYSTPQAVKSHPGNPSTALVPVASARSWDDSRIVAARHGFGRRINDRDTGATSGEAHF